MERTSGYDAMNKNIQMKIEEEKTFGSESVLIRYGTKVVKCGSIASMHLAPHVSHIISQV